MTMQLTFSPKTDRPKMDKNQTEYKHNAILYLCKNLRNCLREAPSLPAMACLMAPLLINSCITATGISGCFTMIFFYKVYGKT